ncbi:type II toxin-antitoxin system CcdA family antitoxin [Endozoicomonas arenosclerae]|uniref:type II toxin-antitoxin system CcdA family antitoxin n=1 Tax=Endozoicomonas arenosclerae TaxID=1633495 RepID=UPI000785DA85|nr:type II toxin-antitoxin system CcdA family antitoxin [Endozoicomonas arenosclerae]
MAKARTSISLDEEVLENVKRLNLNLSEIANEAAIQSIKQSKTEQWKQENKEALDEYNAFIERHGTFGEKHGVMFKNEPI